MNTGDTDQERARIEQGGSRDGCATRVTRNFSLGLDSNHRSNETCLEAPRQARAIAFREIRGQCPTAGESQGLRGLRYQTDKGG
jgi:hypothetical protein